MKIPNIEFGEPWRYNEKFFGIIVPVLRKNTKKRDYVTLEEVNDKLNITDTGQIDKAKIASSSDSPVFLRMGTILEGVGTQSRAVTVSTVILPQSEPIEVPVKCIHQSHGISTGSQFRCGGIAPVSVVASLASGNQGRVWNSVRKFSSRSSGLSSSNSINSPAEQFVDTGGIQHDDLVGVTKRISEFKSDINDIIKKAPKVKDQIGIVVLDFEGVVGFEAFDSPESWKAVSEDVIKKYGDTLTTKQEQPLFELKKDMVLTHIDEFLIKLKEGQKQTTFENNGAKTVSIKGDKVIGEYTTINKKTIHIIGLREEHESYKEQPVIPMYRGLRTASLGDSRETDINRGTYNILTAIDQGENRWGKMTKKLPMSTGTLSHRLKSYERRGWISKKPVFELGKTGIEYNLTGSGKSVLSNLNGIRKNISS